MKFDLCPHAFQFNGQDMKRLSQYIKHIGMHRGELISPASGSQESESFMDRLTDKLCLT